MKTEINDNKANFDPLVAADQKFKRFGLQKTQVIVLLRHLQIGLIYLFFFQKSKASFAMGQTSLNCDAKPTTPRDLFSQQLNIYQWRANPNNNIFVSRVSFKNAYTQKQEQKFAEFLRQQEQENYLEIYKFKEEVEDFRNLSNEEVIIFQKYSCTLKDLIGRLRLEDVLYTLHGLLLGYQEIRKIYERIIVEDCCCFVTNEGELRVWINPNPKSNQVWNGIQEQLTPQISIRAILTKIVGLAERMASRTLKSEQFFRIMYSMLSKSTYKHCYYADLRRVINEYCYLNSVQMSKNLLNIIKLKESQRQFRKSYKRQQRNTQTSYVPRQKIAYMPTAESQSNLQHGKSFLMKSKSLENHGLNNSNANKQHSNILQTQGSQMYSCEPLPHTLPTVSHIFPKRIEESRNANYIGGTQRNSHIIERQQIKQSFSSGMYNGNKASTFVCSQGLKKSGLINSQIIEVESNKSNNSKTSSVNPTPFENKNQNTNLVKGISKTDKGKKGKDALGKHMQVSIMENMKNQNCPPAFSRPEGHHRTHMDRHSIQESSQSELYWSRPWITTKTLTKLISDHDSSLKNSIAQSSDYYNQSVYSGALTLLGRDIAPPNADRSKTVRVSRDR